MNHEEWMVRKAINNQNSNLFFLHDCLQEEQNLDYPKDKLLIIQHSHGNNHTQEQYSLYSKVLGSKFLYATSNYSYFRSNHDNIVYYPYYFFDFLYVPGLTKYDIKSKRPYKLQCLNLNPWVHRTINYLEMSKKPWFSECKFSFNWTLKLDNVDTTPIGANTLHDLPEPESDEIKRRLANNTIPIFLEDWKHMNNPITSNQCFVHRDCYIDYVTENSVNQEFITEKTWKPIFSGQLFLILGSKGIIAYLRKIGIDTFDDIIDHSYDQVEDLRTKISMIHQQLDRLMTSDLDTIWDNTYERRKKNLELVYDPEFHNFLLEEFVKKVS